MKELSIQGFQLSPQQRRLWSLQQTVNHSLYRSKLAILIEGKLQVDTLKLALQKVIERHEILRTTFQSLAGMSLPLQVITSDCIPVMRYHDLQTLAAEQKASQINLLLDVNRPISFDLQHDPVFQISLIALALEKHLLLIDLPALCSDSKTVQNLWQEISQAYIACLEDEELADEPLQYADIAAWQNELFEGEEAAIGKEYWSKQKISELLDAKLPLEKASVDQNEFLPQLISVKLQSIPVEQIEKITQSYGGSVATFLLACWQTLLFKLTGRSDLVIGTGCDGRNYDELTLSLGLLAKYLPVCVHFDQEFSFSAILKRVGDAARDALTWQEAFTWEQISTETAFFPFCFDFEEQLPPYLAGDVLFSIYQRYTCIDKFKVKLACLRQDNELIAEFHYDANCFDTSEIERLASQFQTLLESAIANPNRLIGELEILNESAYQQLLIEFNNTATDSIPYPCLHYWFEAQAAQTPDSIAVVFENQQLTYRELNTQANQLAHYLQKLGVKPEGIVGLWVERSLQFIIGLLGILKSGAAYLPLDPLLPAERLSFMLQDAQASFVIVDSSERENKLSLDPSPIPINLATDCEKIAQESRENPGSEADKNNLVYVIYTSGSTGKPKGVAVEHQSLVNYVNSINTKLNLPAGASFALVSTFAADLGNTAIFPALCTGGCLHIIAQERTTDPVALADYFTRYSIDCLKIVPSHLNALLSSNQAAILPQKRLILGGEVTSWALIEQVRKYAPHCQMFNHYGPTEATVGATIFKVEEKIGDRAQTVPIGSPLANAQIYILDSYQKPVPIGVPGELHISGKGLARGYLNQPQLTQEKFIPNPFENPKGSRLYKTGDLARYLPDGNIEFLGRIDHQVKIRGFRIELGEVESTIRQHPAIKEAVVIAREDESGKRCLVAYIVPSRHEGTVSIPSLLHGFLKEKLPDYMVPSAFVSLKTLPLTPNGKVDRQALPNPDTIKPELEGKFVPARTTVEATLAEIWMQVLRVKQVGIYDNFFELGGDSILSIQVIARANKAGLRFTPKQLYDCQTIAELAAVVDTAPTIQTEQGLVTGIVPLTPIQHWFFEKNLLDAHHWNQAILLEIKQALDPNGLKQAVQHLLSHHDALRLRFVKQESGWQQTISTTENSLKEVPFSQIDLSDLPPDEQLPALELFANKFQTQLNLSDGHILQVALFNLGEKQSNRLLVVIHHLAVDGVSWRILLEDLQTVYEQLSQGKNIQLPAKTTSFKQWAELLQNYAQSEVLRQQKDYWIGNRKAEEQSNTGVEESIFFNSPLHSCSPAPRPNLPIDFPEGDRKVASARTVLVTLGEAETQALLQEVPVAYRTQIDDVLLTALIQTFAEWTGNNSLWVDLEGHGREPIFENVDLSRTVGWFTSIFPMQLELKAVASPGEALKAIKEQLRMVPNRGMGYGVLRYLSGDEVVEQLKRLPQPEVKFNYLGQSDPTFSQSSLFGLATESVGNARSLRDSLSYLFDISGIVSQGRLQLDWVYSAEIYRQETVEGLANRFIEVLRSLITYCQSIEVGGYTPSDFPKANVNQKDLNKLLAKLNKSVDRISSP